MSFSGGRKDFPFGPSRVVPERLAVGVLRLGKNFWRFLSLGKNHRKAHTTGRLIRGLGRTHYIDSEILIR